MRIITHWAGDGRCCRIARRFAVLNAVLPIVLVLSIAMIPASSLAVGADLSEDEQSGQIVEQTGNNPSSFPPEGSFVRITMDSGVSPFTVVYHDVTVRGRTTVVTLVKENLCRTGQRESVSLVEGQSALELLANLAKAGVWSLEPPDGSKIGRLADVRPSSKEPRYEFWMAHGKKMTRFFAGEKAVVRSPALLGVITAVRAAVDSRVEPLPMRDLYHPLEKMGYLTMTASESASATIDGRETLRLPLDGTEIVEGEHTVEVVGMSGRTRTFEVRIVAGMTNRVHVVLN